MVESRFARTGEQKASPSHATEIAIKESGDLVIHQMDAFAGAVISDSDGKGHPFYWVCQPTQDANPNYALIGKMAT